MAPQPLAGILLAAGLDWLEGLLPLLFVVIWIASQVLNLFRGGRRAEQAKPRPNPPPERQPRPAARAPQPVRRGGGRPHEADPLDREIEAFLQRSREVGERADGEQSPPAARPRRNAGKPSRRRSPSPPQSPVPPPLPAPGPSSADVDVASHVALAFADDLAHASPTDIDPAATPHVATPAATLLAALRTPAGLRQLVLMREVLERPAHRW